MITLGTRGNLTPCRNTSKLPCCLQHHSIFCSGAGSWFVLPGEEIHAYNFLRVFDWSIDNLRDKPIGFSGTSWHLLSTMLVKPLSPWELLSLRAPKQIPAQPNGTAMETPPFPGESKRLCAMANSPSRLGKQSLTTTRALWGLNTELPEPPAHGQGASATALLGRRCRGGNVASAKPVRQQLELGLLTPSCCRQRGNHPVSQIN